MILNNILLVKPFKNFRNMCLEKCQLDPNHIFTAQILAW